MDSKGVRGHREAGWNCWKFFSSSRFHFPGWQHGLQRFANNFAQWFYMQLWLVFWHTLKWGDQGQQKWSTRIQKVWTGSNMSRFWFCADVSKLSRINLLNSSWVSCGDLYGFVTCDGSLDLSVFKKFQLQPVQRRAWTSRSGRSTSRWSRSWNKHPVELTWLGLALGSCAKWQPTCGATWPGSEIIAELQRRLGRSPCLFPLVIFQGQENHWGYERIRWSDSWFVSVKQ